MSRWRGAGSEECQKFQTSIHMISLLLLLSYSYESEVDGPEVPVDLLVEVESEIDEALQLLVVARAVLSELLLPLERFRHRITLQVIHAAQAVGAESLEELQARPLARPGGLL